MQGLLLINKPSDITSFGVVAKIKRITGEKRVGHTGTLDPMATGVLPIFLGKATALSSYLLDADKEYSAKIRLGIKTDTCDITGNVIEKHQVHITDDQIDSVLPLFLGQQQQQPPIYSAIKKNGIPLYKLAREGKTADIPLRQIFVYSINKLSSLDENNEFIIDTKVSKGTYIRSLCRDIGDKLACPAVLSMLTRTFASGFSLENCVDLNILRSDNINDYILNEEIAVSYLPEINVTEKQAIRFCNGGQLDFERLKLKAFNNGDIFRIKYNNIFLGIGRADCEKKQIAIGCVINYIR